MKKFKNFILLIFLLLIFINIVSCDETKLGEVEISSTTFSIDASLIDTKINYLIDDSISKPKLIITSLSNNGDINDINDIFKISDDKSTITFNDYTLVSNANKYSNKSTNFSLILFVFISILTCGIFGKFNNNKLNILISLLILIGITNSVSLSNVSLRIDIKVPSTSKFNSLNLIVGNGETNINGLLNIDNLKIDACSNNNFNHNIIIDKLLLSGNLNLCSNNNDILINSLELNKNYKNLIYIKSNKNVNLNFKNGYTGSIKLNYLNNLDIQDHDVVSCNLNKIDNNNNNNNNSSNGNCNGGDESINKLEIQSGQSIKITNISSTSSSSSEDDSNNLNIIQPEMVFNYDKSNLVFMAQSGYSDTSITSGGDGENSFKINYIINAPNSNWLVSKSSTPSLKANVDYKFTFSFKLGEVLGKNNIYDNMTLYFYNPNYIQDPNGSNQYFKYSTRDSYYSKTFKGDFSSSTEFKTTTITITPTIDIGISILALQMNRTTKTGSSISSVFIKDMKLIIPSRVITSPPLNLLKKDSEMIQLLKQPIEFDKQDLSTCPYKDNDLVNWNDAKIWSSGSVPLPSSEIVLPEGKKVLISAGSISQTEVYKKITIPATSELVFADSDLTMHIHDIYVLGKFTMGKKSCRYNSNINLIFHGSRSIDNTIDGQYFGNKGIGVASSGFINIHGKQYVSSWTKLAATVWSGDIVIWVQDSINWEVGMQVLITTSLFRDELNNQNEVLTIAAINGKQIQFTTPVRFYHYGGQEYQSEVALLSRKIVINGDGDGTSDSDQFGGHILVQGGGQFSGIQLKKMGQTNIKARYPLHYHLAGTLSDSFISDCSVVNSYYRCYTIHGTNNVTLTKNVAFDVYGHCYYLEDGVEIDNTISYNLAAYIHTIGSPAAGSGQPGQNFVESDSLRQPADSAAGGFYITNAWNSIYGNSASGGWAGFSFPNLEKPIGNHRTISIVPSQYPIKLFEGNTAHSSGYWFSHGASIYVGGKLYFNEADGLLYYSSGRFARDTYVNGIAAVGNELWMRFNNTKIWNSNLGISHWGTRAEVVGLESFDSRRSASLFGESWLSNCIINGKSNNIVAQGDEDLFNRLGFQFYDVNVKTILSNIIFRNYKNYPYATKREKNNFVLSGLIVDDIFKNQGISAIINVTIENSDYSNYIGHIIEDNGSSRYFNFIDYDGSVFSTPKGKTPKLIGSHDNWWNFDNTCKFNDDWLVYVCDKGNHEIATLYVLIPNLIDSDKTWPATSIIGNVSLFSNGIISNNDRRSMVITRNPGITGVSNMGWYLWLPSGSPTYLKILVGQVPYQKYVLFSMPYPPQTTFSISSDVKGTKLYNKNYTLAASAIDVQNGDGSTYYFDQTHLFIKVVNFALQGNSNEYFERGGAKIYDVIKNYFIHISAFNDVTPPTSTTNGVYKNIQDVLPIV